MPLRRVAAPCRARPLIARGFTLIELLVVLVILGVLIGLAVLSTGIAGPGRELRNEAERLAGLVGVLAEEAVLDNREYGVLLTADSYQVLSYDSLKGQWQALSGKPHRLPAWAELSVELDGEPLHLPAPVADKPAASLTPQLLILSSGELSPFRLRLGERRQGGVRMLLSSDGFRLPSVELIAPPGRGG